MKPFIGTAILVAVSAVLLPAEAVGQQSSFSVEVEAGSTWQSYNDVEIPNDGSATRFSLFDLAGSGPWPSARLYLGWSPSERHGVRLLLAPFSLTETGLAGGAIRFAGADYQAGRPLRATYTFNSYRLTYRYRLRHGPRGTAWIGFTGKIRDAVIALEQEGVRSRKDDLGFVPLLHGALEWHVARRWSVGADLDALAGGPGRAVDAAVRLGYSPAQGWEIRAGYRTVEGGADVEEVYTFAWLHQAVLSVAWRP
jgi:hypothetical protein